MSEDAEVVLTDTTQGMTGAVREALDHFGGPAALLKSSRDVYLKANAIDLKGYCHTDPEVVRETIRAFQNGGARAKGSRTKIPPLF